jgi:hypothetical protein
MKLSKSIISGAIALILVISCGIVEVVILQNRYKYLQNEVKGLIIEVENETLTTETYQNFQQKWLKLRESSELLLPHLDVYELNLRVAETQAYVTRQEWTSAYAQLAIISELLEYIPHLMIPNIKHII